MCSPPFSVTVSIEVQVITSKCEYRFAFLVNEPPSATGFQVIARVTPSLLA